jgi:nitrous oxidase accessory protein
MRLKIGFGTRARRGREADAITGGRGVHAGNRPRIGGGRAARCAAVMLFTLILALAGAAAPARVRAAAAADGLQARIDRAGPGDVVRIPAGEYSGPLVIDKPLTLLAEGDVRLQGDREAPAVHITADGVAIRGLTIVDTVLKPDKTATVLVEADGVRLANLSIRTVNHGIRLVGVTGGEIRDSTIEWAGDDVRLSERGNGIDLFRSHRNRIAGNTVAGVHDGIYIEGGDDNEVEANRIDRSRYGVHLMYTNRSVIRGNTGSQNITGIMVMTSRHAAVTGNSFSKQNENVHSQGVLLFDVQESRFADNRVEGNRVGFYVEQSGGNTLERNEIVKNYIGIRMIAATGNRLHGNTFRGNVVNAEAVESADNTVEGNYWDAFRGLDTDGDGRSDLAYPVNPFFLNLAERQPAFQLFFQSPGLLFLEGLFAADRDTWLTDAAPLMEPPAAGVGEADKPSGAAAGVFGAMLLAAALFNIWYWGVRRT